MSLIKSKDVVNTVHQLIINNKNLARQVSSLRKDSIVSLRESLLDLVVDVNGVRFLAKEVDLVANEMKDLAFSFRKEENIFLVLGSKAGDDKAILTVMITDDLVDRGFSAIEIVNSISKYIDGGGGGQPFFATAGGKDTKGLQKAFTKARDFLKNI